jgi:hypothetical protein
MMMIMNSKQTSEKFNVIWIWAIKNTSVNCCIIVNVQLLLDSPYRLKHLKGSRHRKLLLTASHTETHIHYMESAEVKWEKSSNS